MDWEAIGTKLLNAGVNYGTNWVAEQLSTTSSGAPGGNTSKSPAGVVGGLTQEQRIQWLMGYLGTGPAYTYREPTPTAPAALIPAAGGAPIYGYTTTGAKMTPTYPMPAYAPPTVTPIPSVPASWVPVTTGGATVSNGFTGFATQASALSQLGAALEQAIPGAEGMGLASELLERAMGAVGGLPTMFKSAAPTARAVTMLEAKNPITGKTHYWRHLGTPILFSGDLANCRRVKRVRAKVNRMVGGKR